MTDDNVLVRIATVAKWFKQPKGKDLFVYNNRFYSVIKLNRKLILLPF